MRFEKTVEIAAPPEAVWRVLEDVEAWPTWTASMTSVSRERTGPLAVGERVRVKQPRLPATDWTVTDVTPPRSFTWTAKGLGVRTRAGHVIEPAGDGRVVVTLTLDQGGPIGEVVGRLGGGVVRRYLDMEAAGLKARSEQGS
jgi:uncharacterized protein YndB with AHSA1/START domain